MPKKISFPCVHCQKEVEIAPYIISNLMMKSEDKMGEILVTCSAAHLNRVSFDTKSGALLGVEPGRLPI